MSAKRQIGLVALLTAVLMVVAMAYIALREPFSKTVDDCRSLETYSREYISNQGDKNYLSQEIRACKGENLDDSEESSGGDDSEENSEATPSKQAPTEEAQPRQWEYLANRPPVQKTAINSFGPSQGLTVDVPLANMELNQAIAEMRHRLEVDPMFAAATKAAMERTDYDGTSYTQVDENTKLFSEDHVAWDEAVAEINRWIDQAIERGKIGIERLNGDYVASYSIPGETPSVRIDANVPREGQPTLRIHDKLFQLECGFQEYWTGSQPIQGPQAMPKPSPGMSRTPEGTPVVNPPTKEPPTTTPPTSPPTTEPPTTTPPTTPTTPPTTEPPTTTPPTLEPKPSNPGSSGVPPANATGPAQAQPDPVVTEQTGGGSVVDNATNAPGSEAGIDAPGANPAPADRNPPVVADGGNDSAGNECVVAPGETNC